MWERISAFVISIPLFLPEDSDRADNWGFFRRNKEEPLENT
jgi:hypothetical protein